MAKEMALSIHARNLTPIYGSKWSKYSLNPFRLAEEYNVVNPLDKVMLGAINFGATKLRIREVFAKFSLRLRQSSHTPTREILRLA